MAKAKNDKALARFVKDHVETKLVRAGWDPEKACDLVAMIPDEEIMADLKSQKVGTLGDGKILKWLAENGPAVLKKVEELFSLLSLFAGKPQESPVAVGEGGK